jgi:hypothetical protein
MFRKKSQQRVFHETSLLMPSEKLARLQKTWAWVFREHALPMIKEEMFAGLYNPDNGRPNVPVKTLVGLLLIKELFDWTDDETLWQLEYHLGVQAALDLTPDEAHLCQKTLHNFRAKLIAADWARVLFKDIATQVIEALGIRANRQRLDSTHVVSNIAILTRLGLFCETVRVFLKELRRGSPEDFAEVPQGLAGRYLDAEGEDTRYEDAKAPQRRRRLSVCARDVHRLIERFRGREKVEGLASWALLKRLFSEQCEVRAQAVREEDADDAGEESSPAAPKEAKEVDSSSLQTPHDPDATYSGHKGKGYEVQIAETFGEEGKPSVITYAEVTPSCKSDADAALPAVQSLAQRGIAPETLVADTTYGSTKNAMACAEAGVDLVSPVPGPSRKEAEAEAVSLADFQVSQKGESATRCPAGHRAVSEQRTAGGGRLKARFNGKLCAKCGHQSTCPAKPRKNGDRHLSITVEKVVLSQRLRREATEEFRALYNQRAGIEGSNSELKRGHGMGLLRVRGAPRVAFAVFFKLASCNIKRMLKYVLKHGSGALKKREMGESTPFFSLFGPPRACSPAWPLSTCLQ